GSIIADNPIVLFLLRNAKQTNMILIVGGSGFLGRHFRDVLSAKGQEAVIVTRDIVRAKEYWRPGEQFVGADWFEQEPRRILSEASAVVYLATGSTPATFAERAWLEIPHVTAPICEFMLKSSSINPSAKRIFVSSGGTIYGNPQ